MADVVDAGIDDKLFYPITFPVTTGAGTISVLFTLSAHGSADDLGRYLLNTGAIVLAIALICALVFVFYSIPGASCISSVRRASASSTVWWRSSSSAWACRSPPAA